MFFASERLDCYEYKIRPSDTLSGIIFRMFGHTVSDSTYQISKKNISILNLHITNPNYIRADDILRFAVLHPIIRATKPVEQTLKKENVVTSQKTIDTITKPLFEQNIDDFWALA